LSLQSNLLPPSLLGDNIHDMGAIRSRSVTDDTIPLSEESSSLNSSLLLPPPRRSWSIASDDHKALPKVPCHYPPFDPNCTALVTDASPSIVVVRISECLRKRSIAVEYDDESVAARCMTVDRVHFMIQLYRAPSSSHDSDVDMENTTMAPPHNAIIVEVRKITGGSSLSFHGACSKILLAAKGLEPGDDERPSHRRNGMEFRPRAITKRRHPSSSVVSSSRLMKRRKPTLTGSSAGQSSDRSSIAEESLEAALGLLHKDRLECQQLGMERLVNLTNKDSVGSEICRYVSRRLLLQEQQLDSSVSKEGIGSSPGNWKLIDCLMHPGAEQALELAPYAKGEHRGSSLTAKSTPSSNDTKNDRMVRSFLESPALTAVTPVSKKHSHDRQHSLSSPRTRGASFLKKRSLHRRVSSADAELRNQSNDKMSREELRHEAKLRSLGMRVFCNALDNLSKTKELQTILHPPNTALRTCHKSKQNSSQSSRWVKPAFLLSLVQDLQGAGRPPSVSESGYKLASVHEAALAARCLRLLAGYDGDEDESNIDSEKQAQPHKHKTGTDTTANCVEEQEVVRSFLQSEAVLNRLDYARSCGRATHAVLHYEAERTYHKFTEDDRSC
jgi:hypothetical protein